MAKLILFMCIQSHCNCIESTLCRQEILRPKHTHLPKYFDLFIEPKNNRSQLFLSFQLQFMSIVFLVDNSFISVSPGTTGKLYLKSTWCYDFIMRKRVSSSQKSAIESVDDCRVYILKSKQRKATHFNIQRVQYRRRRPAGFVEHSTTG